MSAGESVGGGIEPPSTPSSSEVKTTSKQPLEDTTNKDAFNMSDLKNYLQKIDERLATIEVGQASLMSSGNSKTETYWDQVQLAVKYWWDRMPSGFQQYFNISGTH